MPKPPRYALAVSAPRYPDGADVVPVDVRDRRGQALGDGDLAHAGGKGGRVQTAGVADQLHAPLEGEAEAVLELSDEVRA